MKVRHIEDIVDKVMVIPTIIVSITVASIAASFCVLNMINPFRLKKK